MVLGFRREAGVATEGGAHPVDLVINDAHALVSRA
jgi:hypothetical protein